MITFRSEVGPDVMMFDEVAYRMMVLLDREKTTRGVITVEQLPAAIARLRAAAAGDRAHRPPSGDDEEGETKVSLAQRALPLIELLEISLAREVPVTWGI